MEEALLFYSFLYRQLCSNKTLMCEQAGGFNFPCHSFLTVSATLRLLNDTIWGKHLKGGPQKRTVIIVSVFSADSPPDSLNTRVLSPWCCWRCNLCPGAHIWFCLSSEKKIETGHLLWKKKNENYNLKCYCCYRRKEDLFLGGKQHQPKLITGSWVRMEMSHLLGVFSGSRVLHSYKAADRTITLSLEGGVSEAAEWALVLFSGDRCLFLLVASKDSAKKKKKVNELLQVLKARESQHSEHQLHAHCWCSPDTTTTGQEEYLPFTQAHTSLCLSRNKA